MSLSSDVIERLPRVEGILNYLAPMAEKPMNLAYDPPPGIARSTGVPEPHRMTIYDARPVAARLSLDGEGLALVEHRSAVEDFYDEDELRRVYYPEAERLVAEATGASRVLVFDHTIRRRVWGGVDRQPGTPRQPVTSVHNDYTVKSGPQRLRDLMGEEADELLRHRFEIINVWRPIRGPLRDAPLAVCDATSVAPADFVPSDLGLSRPQGRNLPGQIQPGAPVVLRAGDAGGRSDPDQVLRLSRGRQSTVYGAFGFSRPDRSRRCAAAREHRAEDAGPP